MSALKVQSMLPFAISSVIALRVGVLVWADLLPNVCQWPILFWLSLLMDEFWTFIELRLCLQIGFQQSEREKSHANVQTH